MRTFALVLVLLLIAGSATAQEGGTNITVTNGSVALSGTVAAGNGGTGQSTPTADSVLVGDGSLWNKKTLPSCSGATNALAYNTTTDAFSCNTISGGGTVTHSVTSDAWFGLSASGVATIYMNPVTGRISETEEYASEASWGQTFTNFKCMTNQTALNLTVQMGDGACSGALTYSGNLSLGTSWTADTWTAEDTDSEAVTDEQCYVIKISISAGSITTPTNLRCLYEES